jgi:hypothetical protein
VGIEVGYGLKGGWFDYRKKTQFCIAYNAQTIPEIHPASYPKGCGNCTSISSIYIQGQVRWSHISTLIHVFMALVLD